MTPERKAELRALEVWDSAGHLHNALEEALDALTAAEAERDAARERVMFTASTLIEGADAIETLRAERDEARQAFASLTREIDEARRERDEARAELLGWKFRSAESGT